MFAEAPILTATNISDTRETAIRIFVKAVLLILLGTMTVYGLHPVMKAGAVTGIIAIFFMTLKSRHYFSFLMLLFITSHFVYINQIGGLYNLAAITSLMLLLIFDPSGIRLRNSSFPVFFKTLIAILFIFQLLSVVGGNDFGVLSKVMGLLVFSTLVILFYFASKVALTDHHLKAFLIIISIMTGYMFLVSLNQKYLFLPYNFPFIPIYDQEAQFEFGLTRSSGTLLNFEAYAEYSLSVIALLLPGVLTGSLKKWGSTIYRMLLISVLIAVMAIVLSGTRSSILLLVALVGMVFFFTKKIRKAVLFLFLLLLVSGYGINTYFPFIDLDIFRKRSEDINFSNLSLAKILKGEDINREETFSLALDRIEKKGGLIGGGYYSSSEEYSTVHFGSETASYLDFHNLYLSSIVIWGYIGALVFLLLFVLSIVKGIKSYSNARRGPPLYRDLLLGFNLLFFLLLINQLKIQFFREVNYFMLILILLAIYHTLASKVNTRPNHFDQN